MKMLILENTYLFKEICYKNHFFSILCKKATSNIHKDGNDKKIAV